MDDTEETSPPEDGEQRAAPAAAWGARVDATIGSLTGRWLRALALALAVSCSIGLTVWIATHFEDRAYFEHNKLDKETRHLVLTYIAASVAVVAGVYLLWWQWRRRRTVSLRVLDALETIQRRTMILLTLPLLAALTLDGFEVRHGYLTLVAIAVTAAVALVFIYRVSAPSSVWTRLGRIRGWLPPTLAALLTLAYMVGISYLALRDHWNLSTQTFDLGIYDNIVWRTANGDFLGCSLCRTGKHTSAHFDPLLAAVVPFYWLMPRAETLLVFQTIWLALGAIPLYLIAARRLENPWFGFLLVVTYLFYPALHGVNMFDFHSLTMVVPLALWAIYVVDRGYGRLYWVVFALILLTREDMALLSCGLGLYLFVLGRSRAAALTVATALAYLALVKLHLMPESSLFMGGGKDTYSFTYFYDDMIPYHEEGTFGLVTTFLTNPVYAIMLVLREKKILFFLHLLLPLLFLPFASGRKITTLLYGLAFIGLASREHVYSLHFQYSSALFPFLLASVPDAIARISEHPGVRAVGLRPHRLRWSLASTVVVATLLTSWKYGVVVPNDAFRAGWSRLERSPTPAMLEQYQRVREMIAQIPPDASVSASSALGPHVSNRKNAYRWPVVNDADYLLVHASRVTGKDRRKLQQLVRGKKYELVDEHEGIQLLKWVEPSKRKRERRTPKKGTKKDIVPLDAKRRPVTGSAVKRPEADAKTTAEMGPQPSSGGSRRQPAGGTSGRGQRP